MKRKWRTLLYGLGGLGVVYSLQMCIALVTKPQDVPLKSVVSQPLAELHQFLTTVSSGLLAAAGAWLLSHLESAGRAPLTGVTADPEHIAEENDDRELAEELMKTREELVSAFKIARAWTRESLLLRQQLQKQGRWRAILTCAVLVALAHPIAALVETALFKLQVQLPGILGLYLQTLLLVATVFAIGLHQALRFQKLTRSESVGPAAAIGFWGPAATGVLSLATVTPAMYQAMSPTGWNVPIGQANLPLFFYLCGVRLLLLPISGAAGGTVGYWLGKRGHGDGEWAVPIRAPQEARRARVIVSPDVQVPTPTRRQPS